MADHLEKPNRALVITQPLGQNYGGLLQAYALKHALLSLGIASDVEATPMVPATANKAKVRVIRTIARLRKRGAIDNSKNQNLIRFRESHLTATKAIGWHRKCLNRYSAFIAGSDQVFRPSYSDVRRALFEFVPRSTKSLKITYAASFGTDDLAEWAPGLRRNSEQLAQRLDAISVRERSGIELVKELWQRNDAQWHVDPTLLVDRGEYDNLITSPVVPLTSEPVHGYGIATYVLDARPDIGELITQLALARGIEAYQMLPDTPLNVAEYYANPQKYQKPPVEEWLRAIRDADLLITDSFHGCVFALIFHTPFLVVPNGQRGRTRFDSLLGMFGLEARVVDPAAAIDVATLTAQANAPINWERVDKKINSERNRSLEYLTQWLNP